MAEWSFSDIALDGSWPSARQARQIGDPGGLASGEVFFFAAEISDPSHDATSKTARKLVSRLLRIRPRLELCAVLVSHQFCIGNIDVTDASRLR